LFAGRIGHAKAEIVHTGIHPEGGFTQESTRAFVLLSQIQTVSVLHKIANRPLRSEGVAIQFGRAKRRAASSRKKPLFFISLELHQAQGIMTTELESIRVK
jgi:hypothetical protein